MIILLRKSFVPQAVHRVYPGDLQDMIADVSMAMVMASRIDRMINSQAF